MREGQGRLPEGDPAYAYSCKRYEAGASGALLGGHARNIRSSQNPRMLLALNLERGSAFIADQEDQMPRFYIELDDAGRDDTGQDHPTVESARNAALHVLASELQNNPAYAALGHWRADLRDAERRLIAHVIVATVTAAPPINWASYDPV